MSKFTILDDFNFNPKPLVDSSSLSQINQFNSRKQIQNDISRMFQDFIMVKTNQYDTYGVYKAKVDCMLCVGGTRYIVAIVNGDNEILGVKKALSNLNWSVFQTRYSNNDNELKFISIPPKEYVECKDTCLNDKITKWIEVNKTDNIQAKSIYKPDNLPLSVEILHMKDSDSFAQNGTVLSALKLFQTIIILDDN